MNGAAGNSLDTTGVLFDLPQSRNLTRSFSRNQEKVGEHIRATVIKEMDLALKLELKATILYEESEEYYEEWIESDENTRKKFGLTVSMIWDGSVVLAGIITHLSLGMDFLLGHIHDASLLV